MWQVLAIICEKGKSVMTLFMTCLMLWVQQGWRRGESTCLPPFKMSCNCCFEQLSPTYMYDTVMPRQLRLETRFFMSKISGTITKTIVLQSSPSKRSKLYGASSKVRLFPDPVGAGTNKSLQDRYA